MGVEGCLGVEGGVGVEGGGWHRGGGGSSSRHAAPIDARVAVV